MCVCIKVKAWGTRGSLPNPSADFMKYGGNTTCFTVESEDKRIILDAGTGLAAMGPSLMGERPRRPIHIVLSHLHMDHIQGLYLFSPLYNRDTEIHFYGEERNGRSLKEQMEEVFNPPYWPVGPDDWLADVRWHTIAPDMVFSPQPGLQIHTMRANHPDQGMIYRLQMNGKSVVYGLDCEMDQTIWSKFVKFADGCDLLISDSFYSPEEYPVFSGRGHSSWKEGVRMARESKAARLLCSHHGWGRTDREMDQLELEIKSCWDSAGFAREGEEVCL